MTTELKDVSKKIKSARMAQGLSKVELAKKMGCNNSYLTQIESGKIPSLEFAFRLENVLGMKEREISQAIIASDFQKAADGFPTVVPLKEAARPTTNEPDGQIISVPVNLPRNLYLKLEWK